MRGDEITLGGSKDEHAVGDGSFKPLVMISQCSEPPAMTKIKFVAIFIPSDISLGDFSLISVYCWELLNLTVFWI